MFTKLNYTKSVPSSLEVFGILMINQLDISDVDSTDSYVMTVCSNEDHAMFVQIMRSLVQKGCIMVYSCKTRF